VSDSGTLTLLPGGKHARSEERSLPPRQATLALVPPFEAPRADGDTQAAGRRLWLCVHLPHLSVSALGGDGRTPFAATEERKGRVVVADCNRAAARAGVHAGMTLAAALSLCHRLRYGPRDEAAETRLQNRIAAAAYRLSGTVALHGPDSVVLEMGGSLELFGGFGEFLKQARAELEKCGACFVFGVAPAARAADWIARHCPGRYILFAAELPAALRPLPAEVLTRDAKLLEQLEKSGIRSVGAFLRLPREGAARRFGPDLVHALDQALGRAPESFSPYTPPEPFCAVEEFAPPAETWARLRFPAARLLGRLEKYLLRRQAATLEVHCLLRHSRDPATVLRLATSRHERRAECFLDLLEKHFERAVLPAPATALAVHCERVEILPPENLRLLDGRAAASSQWPDLLDRLRARLGEDRLSHPRPVADHRPEFGIRVQCGVGTEISGTAARRRKAGAGISALTPNPARPFWLLSQPTRLRVKEGTPWWRGALEISRLPERIEQGWWDGFDVCRDYYLAKNPAGSRLWIFRDRRTGGWYLHGVFA
jgi:protein ImuB